MALKVMEDTTLFTERYDDGRLLLITNQKAPWIEGSRDLHAFCSTFLTRSAKVLIDYKRPLFFTPTLLPYNPRPSANLPSSKLALPLAYQLAPALDRHDLFKKLLPKPRVDLIELP
jgi:hypothetical protein